MSYINYDFKNRLTIVKSFIQHFHIGQHKFYAFGALLAVISAISVPLLFHFDKLWIKENTCCRYGNRSYHEEIEDESIEDESWFRNVPVPPIVVATSDTLVEGACKRNLKRYMEELENGTLWAAQMFDASVKQPYGIIGGLTRHLGSFDQCYRIEVQLPNDKSRVDDTDVVRGRYCIVDFKYEKRFMSTNFDDKVLVLEFDPNDSFWEAIREKGDVRRIRRHILQMALCVPDVCSAEDVEQALRGPYEDFAENNDLVIEVSVDKRNCQTRREEPPFSAGAIIYCSVILGILVLVLTSSLFEETLTRVELREKRGNIIVLHGDAVQLLLCFSARRNARTILEVNYKHRGLDTIHLFRFLSMCLVIFGHRSLQYYLNPVVNEHDLEMTFDIPYFIMLYNGPILVDGFFGIGGLLTCYGLLDQFGKTKRINFIGNALIRFLRFTPVYAFAIFFNAFLFPYLGSGPQWQSIVGVEAENCASTWWASLFYLSNYMTMDRICIFQSWYVTVDFHCYLFAIILVYEFQKWPRKIGYALLTAVTIVSILISFLITYIYRIQPIFIAFPYFNNLPMNSYFCNYYVKTHLRMTAYLIGIIAGAILYDYQKSSQKWRIPKRMSKVLFTLLVGGMCLVSQGLGYPYLNPNSNRSSLAMALYASLHRGAFAIGVCSIVLLITMGDGLDSHYNFLTPGWAQPLGRLTYSAFFSHTIIQSYQAATARSARTFSMHNIFWDLVPDIVYSFILAFIIAIVIEGPLRKMEKYFFTKKAEGLVSDIKKDHVNKKQVENR